MFDLLDCAESHQVLQGRLLKAVVHTSQQPVERALPRVLGDFNHIAPAPLGSVTVSKIAHASMGAYPARERRGEGTVQMHWES
jgi:hypothetical protein